MGQVVNDRIKVIFKYEDIIQRECLIYKSMGIALVRKNGGAMDVRSGINKMWAETQSR